MLEELSLAPPKNHNANNPARASRHPFLICIYARLAHAEEREIRKRFAPSSMTTLGAFRSFLLLRSDPQQTH